MPTYIYKNICVPRKTDIDKKIYDYNIKFILIKKNVMIIYYKK
jgi:hypothetical protein